MRDECSPDTTHQDKTKPPFLDLLVDTHRRTSLYGANLGFRMGRQTQSCEYISHAIAIGSGHPAGMARHGRSHHEPRTDGLAVQPTRITRHRFDGVPKGMTKIQQGAIAALVLVTCHDFGFDFTGAPHGTRNGVRLQRE